MDRRFRWLPAVVVAIVVFAASVSPSAPQGPALGPLGLVGADKYEHAFAYLCLGGALSFALASRRRWLATALLAVIAASLYGGAVEIVQGFVGRDASGFDWMADTLGAVVGTALALGFDPWLARFRPDSGQSGQETG